MNFHVHTILQRRVGELTALNSGRLRQRAIEDDALAQELSLARQFLDQMTYIQNTKQEMEQRIADLQEEKRVASEIGMTMDRRRRNQRKAREIITAELLASETRKHEAHELLLSHEVNMRKFMDSQTLVAQ